jgi:hypothetical protein
MHILISLERVPSRLKRKEAHSSLDQPFDEAGILFDNSIEMLLLPHFTRFWNGSFGFQFVVGFGIRRIFVNGMTGEFQYDQRQAPSQKVLRNLSIVGSTQEEFDGLSVEIYGSIKVHPHSLDLHPGLIHAPRITRPPEMWSTTLLSL